MREIIWEKICSKMTEGCVLPWWALVVRAILYPIDFVYWQMSRTRGYQVLTDTFLIDGVKFSARTLRRLANAKGEAFRFTRAGDMVIIEYKHDVSVKVENNKNGLATNRNSSF